MTATIRAAANADLAPFFAYLDDHLRDNGANGTPLFQPVAPMTNAGNAANAAHPANLQPRLPPNVRIAFIKGIALPVGQPGWRRLWLAIGPTGSIAGHIDVRGRPEPASRHRALLGMGVHRAWRRRGLGRQLVAHALAWARAETNLAWIDLEVLSGNLPAVQLYAHCGFTTLARIADMLQIDGTYYDLSYMTCKLR